MPGSRLWGLLVAAILGASAAACGGSSSPTQPSTPPPSSSSDLTGTWSGSASDSTGPGTMTWQITQSGSSLSGTATWLDANSSVSGRGTLSGSVSGTAVHFSIAVAAGGFDNPFNTCTASVTGDGQVASTSITATYAGSNSCTGAISAGQANLTKK